MQFKFLHLSDLHLALEPNRNALHIGSPQNDILRRLFRLRLNRLFGTYSPDLARATAEFVLENQASLDGLLITGDVATTGLEEDLNVAKTFVAGPVIRGVSAMQGRPTLAATSLPIFLIPGNHDRYATELGAPGGFGFDNVFTEYWGGNSRLNHILFERGEAQLAVIGADFSLRSRKEASPPGSLGYLGQGKVDRETLERLVQRTISLQRDYSGIGILWAVHFPPNAPGIPNSLRLLRSVDFIDAAKSLAVTHIISGHIHTDLTYSVRERGIPITIHCAHTACSVSPGDGNGFQILDVETRDSGRVSISERRYVWDNFSSEFREN
jgi:3',5'-cyclic AMP phosphodiesterase CpdA